VSKFLSSLSPTLRSQIQGQILEGDSTPTLTTTFSRVIRVSTGADVSFAPSIEHQSVMVSRRGCGRNLEEDDEDLLEVDVAHMEADRVPLRKAISNAGTMDAVITSPRSVGRNLINLSGRSYLSLTLLLCTPQDYSSTSSTIPGSSTVVLTQEYDQLRQLEFSQSNL